MMDGILETEVLIIGCGIAGGTAALQMALAGIPVTVVTRAGDPNESNTVYAQGGIIYKGDGDTPELLAEDLIRSGAEFCNPQAVKILAEEGPDLVEKILIGHLGIPFDRSDDDEFSFVKEGGHSVSRILHFKDYTGSAIQKGLIKALKDHPNVNLLTNHTAVGIKQGIRVHVHFVLLSIRYPAGLLPPSFHMVFRIAVPLASPAGT